VLVEALHPALELLEWPGRVAAQVVEPAVLRLLARHRFHPEELPEQRRLHAAHRLHERGRVDVGGRLVRVDLVVLAGHVFF
jgi:hypothetical protein